MYVADQGTNAVTPVTLVATGSCSAPPCVGAAISVGTGPIAIAITPDSQTAYVGDASSTVTPINLATNTAGTPIALPLTPAGVPTPALGGTAVTPNGQTVLVTITNDDFVDPINVATNTAGPYIVAPCGSNGQQNGIAIAPNGQTAYAVSVFCAGTSQFDADRSSQRAPSGRRSLVLAKGVAFGLAITPDGQTAYVANTTTALITPVTLATVTAGKPFPAGSVPEEIAITPGAAGNVAELSLTGSGTAASVAANTHLTYPLTATNTGPQPSTGTTLTDTLPANTTFVSATSSQGSCSLASGTVTCSMSGLAVGASATVQIVVIPTSTAVGPLNDTAGVFGNEVPTTAASPATANISTTVTAGDPNAAALLLTNSGSPSRVPVNGNLTYTVTATNLGAAAATNVAITDPLPASENFVSSAYSPSCSLIAGTVTCPIAGGLAPGASGTVTIGAIPIASGTIADSATVKAAQTNPNPADATATATNTAFYTVYVANSATASNSVTPISTATNLSGTPITGFSNPFAIAVAPNGQTEYVANMGAGTVSAVNLAASPPTIASTITIGTGTNPEALAVSSNGQSLYVADEGTNAVTPVTLVATAGCASPPCVGTPITVGTAPEGIAITPDGQTVYVTNSASASVSVISTATNTVTATDTVGTTPTGVAVTPNGQTAYVVNSGSNSVTPISVATNSIGAPIIGVSTGNATTADHRVLEPLGDRDHTGRANRVRRGCELDRESRRPVRRQPDQPLHRSCRNSNRRDQRIGGHSDQPRRQDRFHDERGIGQRHADRSRDEQRGRGDPGRHQPARDRFHRRRAGGVREQLG